MNPTDPKQWKWKAATFRRVLGLCKTEESQEEFIAREFAGIYEVGLVHGRSGTGFTDLGPPTRAEMRGKQSKTDDIGAL
jgi:hypothetical protein